MTSMAAPLSSSGIQRSNFSDPSCRIQAPLTHGWGHFYHREQERKQRVKGIEAVKASINAAKSVSRILRSSLGPKGMDKMLQSPDGDVTISKWTFRCMRQALHGTRVPTSPAAPRLQPTTVPPFWR